MPRKFTLMFATMFLLTNISTSVTAAPFCVEASGIPAECFYYDISQCKQAAAERNGFCSANLQEVSAPEIAGAFCLVDAGMKPECYYPDGETCNQAASTRNAVCFENVQSTSVDPYRLDRPLFKASK